MNLKKSSLIVAGLGLALGLVVLATGFSSSEAHLTCPALHFRTADERNESLDALRDAWANRPLEVNAANDRAERMFLNRLIYFLNRTKHTYEYSEACGLWNGCYHDHATRYRDFVN